MLYQNMNVQIGLDMSSAFDTVDRDELMQILELVLEEYEIRMCRLLSSETYTTLHFGNDLQNYLKQIKDHHKMIQHFFNIAFENADRDLCSELNKNNHNIKCSYSKVSFIP